VKARGGSVIMEYVVIQALVACLLMAAVNASFYNIASARFVQIGADVVDFYQRLLAGLSLPIP